MKASLHVNCKNRLGEGCFWDPRTDSLWWTDIEGSCIYQLDKADKLSRFNLPGRAGFILPRSRSGFVIGFPNQIALADDLMQTFTRICDVEPDLPTTRVNDAAVDPYGGIVFGTFDETFDMAARRPIGSVYRLSPEGDLQRLFCGAVVSNGLAFSPDGTVMYFADTHFGSIRRFAIGSDFSSVEEITPLASEGSAPGRPDGAITDSEGNYWSARVWGHCVVRFDKSGQVTAKIDLPTKGPTCVAIGGPDLRRLFITTLRVRHTDAELDAAPLAGGLFSVELDIPGSAPRLCTL
jgi:L-arabinonolactonase